jgi:hypothetical protein
MSCSICWEDTKEKCILLQKNIFSDSIKNYKIDCLCNISIHKSCMNKWITINKSCPICHKILYEYQSFYLYNLNILTKFIKNVYCIIVNIILSLCLLHFILIIYLIYFIKLYYEVKLIYYNIIKYL